MSRFQDRPSPAYLAAVAALRALSEDEAMRAAAEVVAPGRRQLFLAQTGWREKTLNLCVRQLLGKRCTHGGAHRRIDDDDDDCLPPGSDHVSMFTGDGRTHLFLSQPYDLSWEALKGLVAYCERVGLEADLDGASWHFPGRTFSVMIRPATSRQLHPNDG